MPRRAFEFGVPVVQLADYRPRYNIAPGPRQWIVRNDDREALRAGYGLISQWAKDKDQGYKQINARAETVHQRPAFRDAFRNMAGR